MTTTLLPEIPNIGSQGPRSYQTGSKCNCYFLVHIPYCLPFSDVRNFWKQRCGHDPARVFCFCYCFQMWRWSHCLQYYHGEVKIHRRRGSSFELEGLKNGDCAYPNELKWCRFKTV